MKVKYTNIDEMIDSWSTCLLDIIKDAEYGTPNFTTLLKRGLDALTSYDRDGIRALFKEGYTTFLVGYDPDEEMVDVLIVTGCCGEPVVALVDDEMVW